MVVRNEVEILPSPLQSPSDRKSYRLLKLANGMRVLLVQNATCGVRGEEEKDTNFAAVALCVDVGSFDDPREALGMAHLTEHLVFMGTEKYPAENEFDSFIKNRNGLDNAQTEMEYTLFYFKIGENHLSAALDRLSQFFIRPLMSIESLEREIEAVESEFQNNVNNDAYRINQIFASVMAKADSCASNFTWGNLKTLKAGIDSSSLHKILHDFQRKFYKANFMNLCIQSSANLDILQAIVTRYFSDIRPAYASVIRPMSVDPFIDVFRPEFHNKIYFVKSLSKKRKFFMTFLLPSIERDYRDKSLEYVAYLLAHEGRHGLCAYFKRKNLALHVVTRIGARSFEGNSMFTLFTIDISLTREGYENVGKILDAIFSYLLIVKMTPMEIHKEIFGEFKATKEILFKYRKEKPTLENVQELVLNMKYFEGEDVIVGREMCNDFNESSLKQVISKLNDRRFNLLILSDEYHKYDKIEKWFGTEFAEVDFPQKFNQLWNERWIRSDFSLPEKNGFICKNFDIVSASDESEVEDTSPRVVFKNDFCKCLFKADRKFLLPHGFVHIHFVSPLTQASVENLNMTSIYSMCVKNFLLEKLYPATLVGYSYQLNAVSSGLILRLSGFNEKLPLLTDKITRALRNVDGSTFDKLTFDTFKKELRKNCYNYLINSNHFIEDIRLHTIMSNHKFYFDRFKATEKIDFNMFKEFLHNFFNSLKIRVLIQGNFTKPHALAINEIIMRNVDCEKSCTKCEKKQLSTYKIPCGSTYLKVKSLLPNDGNSVVQNYYQIGVNSLESACLLELLVKTIREPLFNKLRTQQQLGYAVSCSSKIDNDILGFSVFVESQERRNSARLVDAKIEDFLWDFLSLLNCDMSESDFEVVKRSAINQKRSIDIALESEVARNWTEIRERRYQFDRREIEARQLELLTKESLVIFFKEFLLSSSRRKLSIHVLANAGEDDTLLQHGYIHLNLLAGNDDTQSNTIRNLLQFKQTLETFASN